MQVILCKDGKTKAVSLGGAIAQGRLPHLPGVSHGAGSAGNACGTVVVLSLLVPAPNCPLTAVQPVGSEIC